MMGLPALVEGSRVDWVASVGMLCAARGQLLRRLRIMGTRWV